ncbi:MAG TPA: ferrochelatase [Chitinophagales bacterium]|nr:ferrochelatase [Chitinophagales bacterium]HRK26798.1 ferrochelatase [Chitinophagales bacterium]
MQETIGILLVNLGTPDSFKTADVRRYLNEFLTDGRVIDIPWLPRQLLVRGIISPFRAGNSAKSYKEIWTEKGSPLKYISQELALLLQESLNQASPPDMAFEVELAMRYQQPSITNGLTALRNKNCSQYIILPLFPQYASATTGSIHQRVMEIMATWHTIPPVYFINSYFNNPLFIDAFAERGKAYNHEQYDYVLFSFHGLPQRQLRKADNHNYCLTKPDCCQNLHAQNRFCYGAQCWATAKAIAQKLQIPAEKFTVTYQSRLGKDPWIQPYTIEVLEKLAKEGKKRILVFCPAFVADCLETIYEIGEEYQEEFTHWGGEKVQLVESLNAHPLWVKALTRMALDALPSASLMHAH